MGVQFLRYTDIERDLPQNLWESFESAVGKHGTYIITVWLASLQLNSSLVYVVWSALASYLVFMGKGKNAWFQPFAHAQNFPRNLGNCYFGVFLCIGYA